MITDYIARIKLELKVLVVLLCALAANASALTSDAAGSASGEESPYSSIWLRNVFDLKPVPPPASPDAKTNEPPPNVHLTGITTILGNKRALFMVQNKPQPGKPPEKDKSYILAEGQRQDRLEVVSIDLEAATVKISLDGVVSTITFDKTPDTGVQQKAVASAPPGGNHGNSMPPGGFAPGTYHGGHQRVPLNYGGGNAGTPGYPAGGNYMNNQGAVGMVGGGYNFNPTPAPASGSVPPGMSITASPAPNASTPDNAPPDVTSAIAAAQRMAAAAAAAQSGGSSYTPSPYSQGTGAGDPSQSTAPNLPNFGSIPAAPTSVTIPPLPANYSTK